MSPSERALPAAALAALFGYALAVLVPALLVLSLPAAPRLSAPAAAAFGVAAYAALRLALLASSGEPRIVTLAFWAFAYLFLGLCPLLQIVSGRFPLGGQYDDALLARAGLVVLAGLLAFDAGQKLFPARLAALAVPRLFLMRIRKPGVVAVALLALAVTVLVVERLGGWRTLFLPRIERDDLLAGEFSSAEFTLLKNLARAPVFAVLMAALAAGMARGAGLGWKALCAALLVATLVVNNPISAPRLAVGTVVLSLFFMAPWRRWFGALTVAGLVAGLIFVFPLADVFRVSLDASIAEQWDASSPAQELARSSDFDAFQQLANTVALVEREGVQHGRQVAAAFLFAVPRSLWPDKPLPTGQLVGEKTGYSFTNLSAPLWAELYVDGGLFLVCAGFLAYGLMVRTLERWHDAARRKRTADVLSVLVPIFAGYQFFLLRGSLMPAIAYLAPIVLFALFCGLRLALPRPAPRACACTS